MQFVLRYNHNSTGSKSYTKRYKSLPFFFKFSANIDIYCNTHKKTRKKTFLRDIYMG